MTDEANTHQHGGPASPAENSPHPTRKGWSRAIAPPTLLIISFILFLFGVEFLLLEYFPEASVSNFVSETKRTTSSQTKTVIIRAGEAYEGLNEPLEPLLTDARRGFAKPGEVIDFGDFTAELRLEPEVPIVGKETKIIWTFLDNEGNPVSEWGRSVHRTLTHTYLIRSNFESRSFHLHPSVREDGTMTEPVRFSEAGEWALSAQMAKDTTMYLLTSTFDVVNTDGTLAANGSDTHTEKEKDITGARGVDFVRTFPLSNWDIEMRIEGGEPIYAGEPFTVEWIATERKGEKAPELRGGILDGGHNILLANIDDPSLIWNMHGDRSPEPVSHFIGLPTYRWPTNENPFKYTLTFSKPGLWWIHFEIQSNPIHFFIDVAENRTGVTEIIPINAEMARNATTRRQSLIENVLDYFSGSE